MELVPPDTQVATARDAGPPPAGGRLTVGRERELGELAEALDGALAGRGGLVVLLGEAGIGKTHLAEVLAARARERGANVAWGAGWDGGGAPALWPWTLLLRDLLAVLPPERVVAAAGRRAAALRTVLPELDADLPAAPDAPVDPEEARFQLFDALGLIVRWAAAVRPLVLVLDDLHWADDASLRALEFVARTLPAGAPVLIAGTAREHAAGGSGGAGAGLAELAAAGRTIPLRGLAEDEVARLVDRRAGRPVPARLVRRVRAVSGGNPFFADELIRLLAAEGRLDDDAELPLPERVRAAVARRLSRLAPQTRRLLDVGAVLGAALRPATLAAAAGTDGPAVLRALGEALADGLVEQRADGVYAFRHALVRDTVLHGLAPDDRVRLHGTVARALQAHYGPADEEHLAELAFHFLAAVPAIDAAEALGYALAAARGASARFAWSEAIALLERAAALGAELPAEPARDADLHQQLGEARMRIGDLPGARVAFGRAAALGRAVGDPARLARAALAAAPWGLSVGVVEGELVGLLEEAAAALDRAPDDAETESLRALTGARLASALYWSGERPRRVELARQALGRARALAARPDVDRVLRERTLAVVLTQAFLAGWGPDTVEAGLATSDEILALTRRTGLFEVELNVRSWRISLLFELGQAAAAEREIDHYGALAARLRQPRVEFFDPLHRAMAAAFRGNFADAEAHAARAAELGARVEGSIAPLLTAAQLGLLRVAQGRGAELEPFVQGFVDGFVAMPAWRVVLMAIKLQAGKPAEAREALERFVAHDLADLPRDNLWVVALAHLADVVAELGDADQARTVLGLLEPYAGRVAVSPEAAVGQPVTRHLGAAAVRAGEPDRALALLATAEAAARRLGTPVPLAHAALWRARALVARGGDGDAAQARAEAVRAAGLAARLALPHVEAPARALAAELGDAPAPAPALAAAGRAGGDHAVLRREGDVWAVGLAGRVHHLRDAKGLHQLALLVSNPGLEVHAVDLSGAGEAGGAAAAAGDVTGLSVRALGNGPAGPALDAEAKRAYRARLAELGEELDEATAFNDPERARRAREELDWLEAEIARAVGLGGRDRPVGSDAERARVNVTRAIRGTVRRIAAADPELGRLLDTTVRTGTFCVYEPDPRFAVEWEVVA
jgi:tetratricopeptide (TPR) repeat protein